MIIRVRYPDPFSEKFRIDNKCFYLKSNNKFDSKFLKKLTFNSRREAIGYLKRNFKNARLIKKEKLEGYYENVKVDIFEWNDRSRVFPSSHQKSQHQS